MDPFFCFLGGGKRSRHCIVCLLVLLKAGWFALGLKNDVRQITQPMANVGGGEGRGIKKKYRFLFFDLVVVFGISCMHFEKGGH